MKRPMRARILIGEIAFLLPACACGQAAPDAAAAAADNLAVHHLRGLIGKWKWKKPVSVVRCT